MSAAAPRVSALVVSRGRPERLRACLTSVQRLAPGPDELLVLANGCDATAQLVRAEFPQVRLLVESENTGCVAARNRLAAEARGSWLLFLDDDGELRDPRALGVLLDAAARDAHVAVVSMALFDATSGDPTGWRLSRGYIGFPCYHASFAGGASLVRRDAFRAAGGYDPAFRGHGEEFDLAVRLYAGGHAVLHLPDAVFHHHVDKTELDWRAQVSAGFCHLQYTIARLYPAPWHVPAGLKALATQLWIDVRHHGGTRLLAELRDALAWRRRGRAARAPVELRALERLYFAKYHRVADWAALERAPRGALLRVLVWRIRRKLRRAPKL